MEQQKKLNVLVTGGFGYIGSHMVYALINSNHKPVVIDNLTTGEKARLPNNIKHYNLNLLNRVMVEEILKKEEIDVVMHFAASVDVNESIHNPSLYYKNNVAVTIELLDAMKNVGVKKIIFSSTAAVYGEVDSLGVDENCEKNPINPYGHSKLMCEQIIQNYIQAYNFQAITLRYFNAASADPDLRTGFSVKRHHHLIPIVLSVVAGEASEVRIYGSDYDTRDGTCIRDYIHVNDLANAHLLAMMNLMKNNVSATYNLGNGGGYSVREVITAVENVTGVRIPVVNVSRRDGDPSCLVANASLAKEMLGWCPKYPDIEAIIDHAWKWYQACSLQETQVALH